jgi:nucleoside-diphosphate-sugar epimerase
MIDENVLCVPNTAYGIAKERAEEDLLKLAQRSPLRLAIVRPPTIYGAGERGNFLYLTRAVDSGLFLIPAGGHNRFSLCHVNNLVRALCFTLEHEEIEGLFHVADFPPRTLRQVVQTIAGALKRWLIPIPFPMPAAIAAAVACEGIAGITGVHPPLSRQRLMTLTRDFALDCSALMSRGFHPAASFELGVQETIDSYRSAGVLRRQVPICRH